MNNNNPKTLQQLTDGSSLHQPLVGSHLRFLLRREDFPYSMRCPSTTGNQTRHQTLLEILNAVETIIADVGGGTHDEERTDETPFIHCQQGDQCERRKQQKPS